MQSLSIVLDTDPWNTESINRPLNTSGYEVISCPVPSPPLPWPYPDASCVYVSKQGSQFQEFWGGGVRSAIWTSVAHPRS